jgi:hypothetical protein
MDASQVRIPNRRQQRLKRYKTNGRGGSPQEFDSFDVLFILNRCTEPYVREDSKGRLAKQAPHAIWPLGQNLKRMPVRLFHDLPDAADEFFCQALLEKVRHRVDKNTLRLSPCQRSSQSFRIEIYAPGPNVALARLARRTLVLLHPHRLKPGSHAHRIAVGTARRDERAPGDRIPRRLSPFDL